jgi:hypothetical protein
MLEYTSKTQELDSDKIEILEGYASAVRKQYDSIKDKAGEFNVSLLEDLEEYIRQADNLDKRTEITWECIASYGRMAEGINK